MRGREKCSAKVWSVLLTPCNVAASLSVWQGRNLVWPIAKCSWLCAHSHNNRICHKGQSIKVHSVGLTPFSLSIASASVSSAREKAGFSAGSLSFSLSHTALEAANWNPFYVCASRPLVWSDWDAEAGWIGSDGRFKSSNAEGRKSDLRNKYKRSWCSRVDKELKALHCRFCHLLEWLVSFAVFFLHLQREPWPSRGHGFKFCAPFRLTLGQGKKCCCFGPQA